MYFLKGPEASLQNIVVLAKPYLNEGTPLSLASLRVAYERYLEAQQPGVPVSRAERAVFVRDLAERERLSQWFRRSAAESDQQHPVAHDDQDADIDMVEGYRQLRAAEPALGPLFDLATTLVFVMTAPQLPGSGSSFDTIGLVYVNPTPAWTIQDVAECLVHEFAHTLLYIDALRHVHHPDYRLLDRPENVAETAITGRRRSMFFAFQSFLIAVEILSLRQQHPSLCGHRTGIHGPTHQLLRTAAATYDSCVHHPNIDQLASPRLKELLFKAKARLDQLGKVVQHA
jgi:hypothetical protein